MTYKIKKNVTLKEFSNETKSFLLKIGFNLNDDIGSLFEKFLKENDINLNTRMDGEVNGRKKV